MILTSSIAPIERCTCVGRISQGSYAYRSAWI